MGRLLDGVANGVGENGLVGHRLICGRDDQHRVTKRRLGVQGGQGHRGRGIAAHGLKQQLRLRLLQLAQLIKRQKAMLLIANDTRCEHLNVVCGNRGQTLRRLLEQTLVALQNQKLLGVLSA